MKIRVKHRQARTVLTLNEEDGHRPTLADLKNAVQETLNISDFTLSLNGKDAFTGSDEATLHDLDIVSGDLFHVLVEDSNEVVKEASQPRSSASAGSTSNVQQEKQKSDLHSLERTGDRNPVNVDNIAGGSSQSEPRAGISTSGDTSTPPGGSTSETASPMDVDFDDDEEAIQDSQVNRYLREPALVRDSTSTAVPQSLQMVYESSKVTDEKEALAVVLHVMMGETGFQTVSTGAENNIRGSQNLPHGWKSLAGFKVTYTHPDPSSEGVVFNLTCVPMGPIFIVHGFTINEDSQKNVHCQLQLRVSDYVAQVQPDVCQVYNNLAKLSRLFKDTISYPLLQKSAEAAGLASIHGFLGLLLEVKLQILKYLDVQSLLRMARVCKQLQSLSQEQTLWRRLYLKDFGRRTNNVISQDWYMLYKEKFLVRKQMREQFRARRCIVPPFLQRPHPPVPLAPVYPPGYIGGDYDRDPDFSGIPGPFGPGPLGGVPGLMRPRPRFDPIGPNQRFRPGRGGGLWGSPGWRGFGPRFM